MDAKWNDIVDNMAVRLGMVIIGFRSMDCGQLHPA